LQGFLQLCSQTLKVGFLLLQPVLKNLFVWYIKIKHCLLECMRPIIQNIEGLFIVVQKKCS
jgi:hypothetical protein